MVKAWCNYFKTLPPCASCQHKCKPGFLPQACPSRCIPMFMNEWRLFYSDDQSRNQGVWFGSFLLPYYYIQAISKACPFYSLNNNSVSFLPSPFPLLEFILWISMMGPSDVVSTLQPGHVLEFRCGPVTSLCFTYGCFPLLGRIPERVQHLSQPCLSVVLSLQCLSTHTRDLRLN